MPFDPSVQDPDVVKKLKEVTQNSLRFGVDWWDIEV